MNLNLLKSLYNNSPYWLKKTASFLPKSLLIGKEYNYYKTLLKDNSIDTNAYSFNQLKKTISFAYDNVPYYEAEFKKIGFHPNDFDSLDILQDLPIIDKDIVRENFDSFQTSDLKNRFMVTTGGSSGDPMTFYQSNNVWAKECAFVHSLFEDYGYDYSIKATFRGGNFDIKSQKFWNFNPIHNEIHFSPFHLSLKSVKAYVDILNKYKPKFFHGYPSAIRVLMKNMRSEKLNLNYKVSSIFLISENITVEDIIDFSSFFGAKVTSFYGHSERIIFAPLIDPNKLTYKSHLLYGYNTEMDGELVGTSFDNYAMPLINYKTGDKVKDFNNEKFEIRGRWEQAYLIGKNDEEISLTALNVHSNIFSDIISFQYVQYEKGIAILLLVPKILLNERALESIREEIANKVKGILEIKIQISQTPLLTERGKFQKLIRYI
ncbi:putative Coenzyme F390 synthetase [Sphingobacterium sp. PM2-P1-29]|nr:putative Coenzyme F390 synthetase [Sphingobacterium sp. PM2-P1-29]